MRVVLLKDISGTGRKGEVKEVSEGYARNFLFPKKLAVAATDKLIKEIEVEAEHEKKAQEKRNEELKKLEQKLRHLDLNFKLKADKSGSAFGSISAKDIVKMIKEKTGVELDVNQVKMPAHLKKIGEHEIELKLTEKPVKTKIKIEPV